MSVTKTTRNMAKKRTDYPGFSNGTEFMSWMGRNCERCIKAEHPIIKCKMLVGYANKGRCKVNYEIMLASVTTGTVTKRVSKIIEGADCPFLKTEWPRRRKTEKDKNYPKLFDE